MTLTQTAYLTVQEGNNEAVFELRLDLEETADLNKSFIMGDRGQTIQEVYEQFLGDDEELEGKNRRAGFTLDGGAGEWQHTLSFSTGLEDRDVTWGDGSDDPQKDASGPDVHPLTRKQIMESWLARTRTDSANPARLYWGEYTDGRFEGTAGAFNQPMFVAVNEYNISSPDVNRDVNTMDGTVTLSRIALFPDSIPDDLDEGIDLIRESLEGIVD